MIDETAIPESGATGRSSEAAEPTTAFCQQCGRPLTTSMQRHVGSGTFCEGCATARTQQAASGWTAVNAGPPGARTGTPLNGAGTGEPNPVLAGFLGLIPGVGAMYNGQYAKGVIHLIVFVVLVSLADNLNWVFWWFVWGWIFYQGFEAYHTAQARRDGLPLPDAFGWNELGEKLGFARTWNAGAPAASRPGPPPPFTPVPEPAPTSYSPAEPFSPAGPAYATAPAPGLVPFVPSPTGSAGYTQVPYNSTFSGTAAPPFGSEPIASSRARHFPAGAAWLIGLGVLFLLGNIVPTWHITGRWLVPILLAGIAIWTGARRLSEMTARDSVTGVRTNVAGSLLGPAILLTLAALLVLQDASVTPLRHSWPALLIVWGTFLLLQRAQTAQSIASASTVQPLRGAESETAQETPSR